jgi:ADP-ribose pyrophosphatase YjhB (NUDIX family)
MSEHAQFRVRCRGIILHNNKLLAVKHPNNMPHYALPGGHLEYGEGIEECFVREIEEDLGIKPTVGRLLYTYTYTDANKIQSVEFFFEVLNTADYAGIEKFSGTHAHELENVLWINTDTDLDIRPQMIAKDFKLGKLTDKTRCINGIK